MVKRKNYFASNTAISFTKSTKVKDGEFSYVLKLPKKSSQADTSTQRLTVDGVVHQAC